MVARWWMKSQPEADSEGTSWCVAPPVVTLSVLGCVSVIGVTLTLRIPTFSLASKVGRTEQNATQCPFPTKTVNQKQQLVPERMTEK